MSNQKKPDEKRRVRRGEARPDRGLFKADANNKENSILNKIFNKNSKETDEQAPKKRRTEAPKSQSRDELARSSFKPIHKFSTEDAGEKTKRKKRLIRNVKTGLLYVGAASLLVAAVFGTISIFKEEDELVEAQQPQAEESLKSIALYNEGTLMKIDTAAMTVGDFLKENSIVLEEGQEISNSDEEMLADGMQIFIGKPVTVHLIQNNITNSAEVIPGTVLYALQQMEISLDSNDIVEPELDTLVYDQIKINFSDVEITQVTVVEDIPYETEEGETSTVESGYYHEERKGENGAIQITYEVRLVNGVEQSREEIGRETIIEPVNRIILWGTAARSSSASSSSGSSSSSSSGSSSSSSSDYDSVTVKNPGEQATNPSVPSAPSSYIETMECQVTAYTHTGGGTATGTLPRSTRTLENPGTVAVVPSTIPYGSLLYVTGYGYCIAEDTGGFRNDPDRWNQLDVFMNTKDECYIWGRRYNVKVYILRRGY
ncbi:MAG: G5 domain-containing protein [Clostridia bacterium]|nr:G5 domain-containing protein [Clostridia bacterium]